MKEIKVRISSLDVYVNIITGRMVHTNTENMGLSVRLYLLFGVCFCTCMGGICHTFVHVRIIRLFVCAFVFIFS